MPLRLMPTIHRASRQISLYLETPCRRFGVVPEEGHLLSYLSSYGPCQISEVQRVFGLKNSTLTGVLDRLERKEILRRRPNPRDRRSFLIGLTKKGETIAERLNALASKLESQILRRLGIRDLAGFDSVMQAIADTTGVVVRPAGRKGKAPVGRVADHKLQGGAS